MALATLRRGVRLLRDPYGFLAAERERHGATFRVELPVLGRALFTGDPTLVEEIARHPELDAGRGIQALRTVLGDGSLITLDGEAHRSRRRLVAPAFSGEALERSRPLVESATRGLAAEAPRSGSFPIYELLLRITRRTILRMVFGELPPEREREADAAVEGFVSALGNPLPLYLSPLRVDLGPLNGWGRLLGHRRSLRALIRAEIRRHRAGESSEACTLAALCSLAPGLDEEALTTEVVALLLFGHDTGASAMTWAMAHLYAWGDPARARAEPDYLEACIAESMRLCPVVAHLTRVASRPTQVGPFEVGADERVLPSAWLAHHDPALFPEPARFRPERFLDQEPISPYAYFPFGIGARICVGRPFVLAQMRWVLGALLQCLELELEPGYRPQPVRKQVLVVPRAGAPFRRVGRRG